VLVLLWLQLAVGIATTFWTMQHLSGEEMILFMGWAQGILTFDPAAADLIVDVALVYKLHIILGLLLFLITPFTRLVHVWSIPIWFLFRPGWQIVRSLAPVRPRAVPPGGPGLGAASYGGPAAVRGESESGQAT
jgi:nitrate reductase gamma subunit